MSKLLYDCLRQVTIGLTMVLAYALSLSAAALSFDEQMTIGKKVISPVLKGTYYSIRPDFRKCISPVCGGYWISPVNRKRTRCADGRRQNSCYVADIEWEAIGLNGTEDATLVQGVQRKGDFPGFEGLNVLIPQKAWRPATDDAPRGTWFGLKDNGVRCITYPCYSIDERILNTFKKQQISGIDLDGVVSANPSDLDAAFKALQTDELIAVGENIIMRNEGPAGDGITMVATQFFLEVQSKAKSDLYCEFDSDCTLSVYHSAVNSSEECYCPLCPQPLNVEAARKNQESWSRNCKGFGFSVFGDIGRLTCPQVLCIAPRPVGCVHNQCIFLDDEPSILQ